jgi:hypothetical protein
VGLRIPQGVFCEDLTTASGPMTAGGFREADDRIPSEAVNQIVFG